MIDSEGKKYNQLIWLLPDDIVKYSIISKVDLKWFFHSKAVNSVNRMDPLSFLTEDIVS